MVVKSTCRQIYRHLVGKFAEVYGIQARMAAVEYTFSDQEVREDDFLQCVPHHADRTRIEICSEQIDVK